MFRNKNDNCTFFSNHNFIIVMVKAYMTKLYVNASQTKPSFLVLKTEKLVGRK